MKKSSFLGENSIEKTANILQSVIENCTIEANAEVLNSVVRGAIIKSGAKVGPFAHIRPNSVLKENVKIGNFVEIKNSVIGPGTKIGHMAYVGDARIGAGCNIGAGVIFCNYDGKEKHKTVVGNNVFIGANCNLVAPVEIGDGAFIAAGTTVTKNIFAGQKIIGRVRQEEFSADVAMQVDDNHTPKFFGTDGIRGVWKKSLTPKVCESVAKALCAQGAKKIVVGRDTRPSGIKIFNILKKYFLNHNILMVDMGVVPTPTLAFATKKVQGDFGVMITASHNPPEFNGLKIFDKDGHKIDLKTEIMLEKDFFAPLKLKTEKGKVASGKNIIRHYEKYIKNFIDGDLSGLRVAIDCANGAGAITAPKVFEKMGANVVVLNAKGVINQQCGALYPQALQKFVKEKNADVGFAFDGDADRVIAVNSDGEIFDGDEILWILVAYFKENNLLKTPEVVGTLLTNYGIEQKLADLGVKLHRTQVGDKNISNFMAKHQLFLGAEQAGHIIFCKDDFRLGDGVLVAGLLCKIYKENKWLWHQVKQNLWVQVNDEIEIHDYNKNISDMPSVKNVIKNFEKSFQEFGRAVVRKSGTEAKLRLMVEAQDLAICKTAIHFLKLQILGCL